MSKKKNKDKKPRIMKRLEDITNFFGVSDPPAEPTVQNVVTPVSVPQKEIDKGKPKAKAETLNSTKKRVEKIYADHIKDLPSESRPVTTKDIKTWILENPTLNVNSAEFLYWFRSPDGTSVNGFVRHFGKLLLDLGIEHSIEVEQKGHVYDYFIEPMSLYIDIDPVSLDTDDSKAKISITVGKSKMDIMQIWRNINDAREGRCKPFRFMAIKERLYKEGVREFLTEYIDWYYQKISNEV